MKSWKQKLLFTVHYTPFTKKSFTLAEVLITLGIIGVVAGMTIPTLMQNVQDNEFKTKMRKEYSVISEAYQLLKTENGGDFTYAIANQGCVGLNHACFKNVFKQKLSYITECDDNGGYTTTNLGVCFPTNASTKYLTGGSIGANLTYVNNIYAGLVLKDGTSLTFGVEDINCKHTNTTTLYGNECGFITMDVNGIKPPNTWGRDIYVFFVSSDAIHPCCMQDALGNSLDNCTTGNKMGDSCAAKYLMGN